MIEPINKISEVSTTFSKSADKVETNKRKQAEAEVQTVEEVEVNEVHVEELVNQVNSLMENATHGIRFERHDSTNETVINVIDTKTDEIIRQIPPEELMKIRMRLDEFKGMLLSTEA